MSDFLDHARDAAQQQNWSLLNRFLEQLLNSEPSPSTPLEGDGLARSLSLALQILECGDFQAKWDVAKLMSAFGADAIDPLVSLLQNDDAELESRWFAARILGDLQAPEAIQALIRIVQEAEDEDLISVAATALANLGSAAIAGLTDLLAGPETRLLAAQTLGQIRRSETIAPLLTVVNDPQPDVRAIAIEALSSFHDPRVPLILVDAVSDPVARVRRAAIAGLGVRADLAAEIDLVALLSNHLWDINLEVCQQAAISLGRIGTDAAVESLVRGFHSPNTPIPLQLEIIRALGWTNRAIALDSLQQILFQTAASTDRLPVYEEGIAILGRWADPRLKPHTSEILIAVLQSDCPVMTLPRIKQAIALALGQLQQPQALEPLIDLLAEEDSGLRLHTIAALRSLNSPLARQQLETLATCGTVPEGLKRGVTLALQEWSYTA